MDRPEVSARGTAMAGDGWICLHRSILDHWIRSNRYYLDAWIVILCSVAHKDTEVIIQGRIYRVPRGASCRSVETWAKTFNYRTSWWTRKKVRTFLSLLVRARMVAIQTDSRTTMLTVCNYDTYQNGGPAKGPAAGPSVGPAEGQPRATDNNDNKENKGEEGAPAAPLPAPPPSGIHKGEMDTIDAAMAITESDAAQERQRTPLSDDRRPPVPRSPADLSALYGARIHRDRDEWEAAIRHHGFDTVAAHCAKIQQSGKAVWLSAVMDSVLSQVRQSHRQTWRERALQQLVGLQVNSDHWNRALRHEVERHAGQPIRGNLAESELPLRIATYLLNHCPDVVQGLIDKGLVSEPEA